MSELEAKDTHFESTVKLVEADPVAAEAMRRRDDVLATLIEQSRQLGPMTSEEKREQRISWVYGNCKLSNPSMTREMVENAVDFGTRTEAGGGEANDGIALLGHVVTIPIAVAPSLYQNPLAALRRERRVKSGRAAVLLGISRQRLHVVEHAARPLPCMQRLVDKAMMVWPVGGNE